MEYLSLNIDGHNICHTMGYGRYVENSKWNIDGVEYMMYQNTTLDDVRNCRDGYHFSPVKHHSNMLTDSAVYELVQRFNKRVNTEFLQYNKI